MKTFDAAIGVAKADPRQAPKLLQRSANRLRSIMPMKAGVPACVVAERRWPRHGSAIRGVVRTVRPLDERFLAYRRRAYRDAGHRLAARADRDLQEFFRCAENTPAAAESRR